MGSGRHSKPTTSVAKTNEDDGYRRPPPATAPERADIGGHTTPVVSPVHGAETGIGDPQVAASPLPHRLPLQIDGSPHVGCVEHERLELEAEHLREQLEEHKRYVTKLRQQLDEHDQEDVVQLEDLDGGEPEQESSYRLGNFDDGV